MIARFAKTRRILCFLLLLSGAAPLFPATVTVPYLELFTKASTGGGFDLQSEGEIDLLVSGGYKFGGSMVLGFLSNNLEQDLTNRIALGSSEGGTLTLKAASIAIQNLLGLPLAFNYFIGLNDAFASGDGFSDLFGTIPITTQYSGFMYFSDGIRYNGIHRVAGTGLRLLLAPEKNRFASALYLYQDAYFAVEGPPGEYTFESGHYSADWRLMLNLEKIHMDCFLGATYPASTWGYYRTGLLFHAANPGGEFLAQIGIPRYDPYADTFGLDLLYLLFEARLTLGVFSIIPTAFLHPGRYEQKATGEGGLIDFNLNFRIGDPTVSLINGGLEGNLVFDDPTLQDFTAKASPYLNIATPGVLWQLKVDAQLFPWEGPANMFGAYIGVKAQF